MDTNNEKSSAPAPLPEDPLLLAMVLERICVNIVDDVGQHGDFLKTFCRAWLRADPENRELLTPAAVALVNKYKLTKHLPGHAE